jgi:hypothetical protein
LGNSSVWNSWLFAMKKGKVSKKINRVLQKV